MIQTGSLEYHTLDKDGFGIFGGFGASRVHRTDFLRNGFTVHDGPDMKLFCSAPSMSGLCALGFEFAH